MIQLVKRCDVCGNEIDFLDPVYNFTFKWRPWWFDKYRIEVRDPKHICDDCMRDLKDLVLIRKGYTGDIRYYGGYEPDCGK